ncbi:hypothetical protein BDR07DRAFT_1424146 [Suillus spraguei]|nr:hypothetical protein BDR07DRAFT_1424146 [Suillus spraguei]
MRSMSLFTLIFRQGIILEFSCFVEARFLVILFRSFSFYQIHLLIESRYLTCTQKDGCGMEDRMGVSFDRDSSQERGHC